MEDPGFKEAKRDLRGLTAPLEKKLLWTIAARIPAGVTPDHLTGLGMAAMILAGASYALSRHNPLWLHAVNLGLALNWFGDSLDGTLARYRGKLRPRYGFYVDHMVDALGAMFLLGGLALSGYMSERLAAGLLVAYLVLSIEIYLATYTRGSFKISYGLLGGTELRILLALANLAALYAPQVRVLGLTCPLFDFFGAVGIIGIASVLTYSVARNTQALYRLERL